MSKRSRAKRFASSPPSAPRISTITFLPSFGSFGQEQHPQLRLEPLDVGLGAGDLGAHLLAVVAVELAEHLLGRLEVAGARPQLLRRLHDRPELAVAPSDLLVPALIGDQRRVAEARFEILVLPLEVSKPIQHRSEATAAADVCAGSRTGSGR